MNSWEEHYLVLDAGSSRIKVGYADPLGLPKVVDATIQRGTERVYPMKKGRIVDWEGMEELLEKIIYETMKIRFDKEKPVLITEGLAWGREDREKMTQIMFENFHVPGLFMAEQAVMALYSCGTINGVVVDSGHSGTEIIPIIDGTIIRSAAHRFSRGGEEVDAFLRKELIKVIENYEGGKITINMIALNDCVKKIKEEKKAKEGEKTSQEHPVSSFEYEGKKYSIPSSIIKQASTILLEGNSNLVESTRQVIIQCDVDKRRLFYDNILWTGGTSLMNGLKEGYQSQLNQYIPVSDLINEDATPEVKFIKVPTYMQRYTEHPEFASWVGASIVAKLIFPQSNQYVTRADYNEYGPTIIHRKSF